MKIATLIARILLGLVFLVFGLNGFLHFIPMGPLPSGLAGEFVTVLFRSHYVLFVSAFQLAGGVLLLVNRYVPLALTLLGPVIVNILFYHLLLDHTGAPMAVVVAILWGLLAFRHRQYFSSLFVQRTS
jgi:putative oxidoreductase